MQSTDKSKKLLFPVRFYLRIALHGWWISVFDCGFINVVLLSQGNVLSARKRTHRLRFASSVSLLHVAFTGIIVKLNVKFHVNVSADRDWFVSNRKHKMFVSELLDQKLANEQQLES